MEMKSYIKFNKTGEIFEVAGSHDGMFILKPVKGGETFDVTATSFMDGTYGIASEEEAKAAMKAAEHKEVCVMENYKSKKKDELLAILAERDAEIARLNTRLINAEATFRSMTEKLSKATKLMLDRGVIDKDGRIIEKAPETPNTPGVVSKDADVCEICSRELTVDVDGYCHNKLQGRHVCMGCQRKFKIVPGANIDMLIAQAKETMKHMAPRSQAPVKETTIERGVSMETIPPEVLAELMAQAMVKMQGQAK